MQKIAILSDIHGNIMALEKVVQDFKSRQVDAVINLGDHVFGPLWPRETAQFLMAQDWLQISGNQDRQLIDQNSQHHDPANQYVLQQLDIAHLEWISTLPASMELQDDILLVHGTPFSDSEYLLETLEQGRARLATPKEITERLGDIESRVILCGHTHIPRIVELSNGILIVNPGSVGLPAYSDETPVHHVIETGSPHARYAILSHVNGDWQVESISVPYDYKKAAAQARKNGWYDWEKGIRYGFMQEI